MCINQWHRQGVFLSGDISRETFDLGRQPGTVTLRSDGAVGFSGFLDRSSEETIEDFFQDNWKKLSSRRSLSMDFSGCLGLDSVAAVLIFRYIRRFE